MEKIWKVIEAANISGMDFFEFNRLLNKSKSIRAVDKYTSAYESIKALDDKNPNMKATLLESGQIYLDILTKEKNEFDAGFDDLVESEIGTQQKKFNDLSTEVGALQQQKAELEKKINEHNVSLGALEDEISTKNVDLQRQRKNFLSTMDTVTADISGKLENIKLHMLLLDEPFGALDVKTRGQMQDLLCSLFEEFKPTIVLVTHDIEEAVYLADSIFILSRPPAVIAHEIKVDLGFHRDRSLKRTEKFLALKNKVEDIMMEMEN